MSCGFAITRFKACGHSQLFKIKCARNCIDFCEPQETLLVTRFRYICPSCITYKDAEDRTKKLLLGLEPTRLDWEETKRTTKTKKALDEAQDVERWTEQYASTIWELRYGACEDPDPLKDDLRCLNDTIPQHLDVLKEVPWCSRFDYSTFHFPAAAVDEAVPSDGVQIAESNEESAEQQPEEMEDLYSAADNTAPTEASALPLAQLPESPAQNPPSTPNPPHFLVPQLPTPASSSPARHMPPSVTPSPEGTPTKKRKSQLPPSPART